MNHKTTFIHTICSGLFALLAVLWVLPATAASLASSDLRPDGYSLPGLRAAGYPNFETGVYVRGWQLGGAGYILHARSTNSGESLMNLGPSEEYGISNSRYHLLARLDSEADTVSGRMLIAGRIDDLGVHGGLLMRAGVEEFAYSGNLIGFNTTDITCPWFDFCTRNGSVYMALNDNFSLDQRRFSSAGLAGAAVPLPAAVWLFAAGLAGLGISARRRGRFG